MEFVLPYSLFGEIIWRSEQTRGSLPPFCTASRFSLRRLLSLPRPLIPGPTFQPLAYLYAL